MISLSFNRVGTGRVPYLSGLQAMEVATETAVTVMATPIVSTPFLSALLRSMGTFRGTQRPVPLPSPPPTAVEPVARDRL